MRRAWWRAAATSHRSCSWICTGRSRRGRWTEAARLQTLASGLRRMVRAAHLPGSHQGGHELTGQRAGVCRRPVGPDAGGRLREAIERAGRIWKEKACCRSRRKSPFCNEALRKTICIPTGSLTRRVPICCNMPTIRWTGTRGEPKRSKRPAPKTSRSSFPSATPRAIGAT